MKHYTSLLALGFCWAMGSGVAVAQDAKIGFINYQRITTESAPAKQAQSKMEQEFLKRQKDLAEQQTLLKSLQEKYERDAPTLSESQRLVRQKEFTETGRDFQRKQREFQEDLSGRRNEELQILLDKATKAVKQVAEAEKYDLVLQEAVYISPRHDITDKVLRVLNGSK
jgi:outer membrane protein